MSRLTTEIYLQEDSEVIRLVSVHGAKNWSKIAEFLDGRVGKQCRERWHNHLDPNIKKGPWSELEDSIIVQAWQEIGHKWADISKLLPGRYVHCLVNLRHSKSVKFSRLLWFSLY